MFKKFVFELKKFSMRGSLIDMAVGFTVGASFTTIAKSLVNDIVMPPVGMLIGKTDFTNLYIVLKDGVKSVGPYETLKHAQDAGALTLNYGIFINNVIAFALVTLVMFFIIQFINNLESQIEKRFKEVDENPNLINEEEVTNKKCTYCKTIIDINAIRCPACTSDLPPNKSAEVKE